MEADGPGGGSRFAGQPETASADSEVRPGPRLLIQGFGNGVEHAIINNAGDGWFTSTFTGTVTIVAYTVDSSGNPIAPDPNVAPYSGHLQTWFGGSMNNKNFVDHDTINFSGTAADGTTFSIHLVDHLSTTPNVAAAPNSFDIGQC